MPHTPKAPADPFDARLVRKLADILTDTGLTEIEVEQGGLKIRVARAAAAVMTHSVAAAPAPVAAAPASAPIAAAPSAAPAPATPAGEPVKSPMVGTVYLQPNPGSPAFAKVGDTVEAGQTLFIIEAMKTMNPVPAPRAGRLVDIVVGDGQPVEFGEPLAFIE
jgi:acetyl-CoA carboxylase biotin carboxyl carrier protein